MKKDLNSLFVPVFKRSGAPFVKGKGVYIYDTDDRKFLDFGSGIAVNALGYAHPVIDKVIKSYGASLLHTSNLYFVKPQIDLAELLIKKSFADKVFFCNSGTEANEAAIKFARKYGKTINPDKFNILSFEDGFHGRTYGALSATAQPKFHAGFDPILDGFYYSPFNDIERTKKVLSEHSFAAIIIEPIQGESGIHAASKEFLTFLRDYCDKTQTLLIFDEIQCGVGRTGKLWGYEHSKVIPDIMTVAKPIGGGLPLGVVLCKNAVVAPLAVGDHGTTFGGNPLACLLGLKTLEIISDRAFLKEVKSLGGYLKKKMNELRKKYPVIEEIRGDGLLIGVQLSVDPVPVVAKCKDNGLLVIKAGHHTIRFIPPLVISQKDIDKAVDIFEKTLASM
ncbi:MAG: aspartate aminotransferase family protein [Fibrobacter sp.]|nr:aspartate aminotransferase family protein [Fibrobacter sp.]